MNLSNPKGVSFDVEGIGCGGGERSKVAGLKKNWLEAFLKVLL